MLFRGGRIKEPAYKKGKKREESSTPDAKEHSALGAYGIMEKKGGKIWHTKKKSLLLGCTVHMGVYR